MTDPFPNDFDTTNGSQTNNYETNGHADIQAKLPQTRPQQEYPTEQLHPETQRDMRRIFLILLVTGLVLGVLTATGVVWVMNRLDLIGVPTPQEPQ
jgi:hypothetical protein